MASSFFLQYLLNKEILSFSQIEVLLPELGDVQVGILTSALEQEMISADLATELSGQEAVEDILLEKGYLTTCQLDELQKTSFDVEKILGQFLLDKGGMDFFALEKLFAEYRANMQENPYRLTMDRLLQAKGIDNSFAYMTEYVLLFTSMLKKLLKTEVAILPAETAGQGDYLIYQNMVGVKNLIVGCNMSKEVLIKGAEHFSQEVFTEVDEIVVDSFKEFCNVINGLFVVRQFDNNNDMELEVPEMARGLAPEGMFILSIATKFGTFTLHLSEYAF